MRRIIISGCVAAALCLALTPLPGLAADSCTAPCPTPPKNSRSMSLTTVALAAFPAPGNTLAVTLLKAKKKRVLRVDAMMTNAPYGPLVLPIALALTADANGIVLQPSGGFTNVAEDCGVFRTDADPDGVCTVNATWWLDIDDPANLAILLPAGPPPLLTVTVAGGSLAAVGPPIDMTVTVSLDKK